MHDERQVPSQFKYRLQRFWKQFCEFVAQQRASTLRTVVAGIIIFLLAILTRNLYAHLSTLGKPLHARVHEEAEAHSHLEVHTDSNFLQKQQLHEHEDKNWKPDASWSQFSSNDAQNSLRKSIQKDPMKDMNWLDDLQAKEQSSVNCICPQITHCHDETIEERCLNYLRHHKNVESIHFDASFLNSNNVRSSSHNNNRAATFFLQYKNKCVRAVAKARTEFLPFAPESEYLAYDADRAVHFFKVPPTTILFVPVSHIENSAQTKQERQWLQRMVLIPARRRGAIINHTFSYSSSSSSSSSSVLVDNDVSSSTSAKTQETLEVMSVSVQLSLFSGRHARGTPFQVSDSLISLLRYDVLYQRAVHSVVEGGGASSKKIKPLKANTISFLLNHFTEEVQKKQKYEKLLRQHEKETEPPQLEGEDALDFGAKAEAIQDESKNLEEVLSSSSASSASSSNNKKTSANPESFATLMSHISDRAVFDAIIGSDMSAAVHGGESPPQSQTARVYLLRVSQVPKSCFDWSRTNPEDAVEVLNDGSVKYLTITDASEVPADTRLLMPLWIENEGCMRRRALLTPAFRGNDPSNPGSICLLRARTASILKRAASMKVWRTLLKKRVHKQILARFGEDRVFEFVEMRLQQMVKHLESCATVLGPESHQHPWS